MKLLRPSLLLFSSILLLPAAAFAGQNRGAISRGSVSHAAVSRSSVSRPAGNFRAVSRNSFSTLGGQRWATNNFSRTSNFSRSNVARTNFSRTNFSGTNLRNYNNFNRGTLASNNTALRNNSVLRSNNLGVNRNFNRVGNGRFANDGRLNRNGNGSGNWNGNWNHNHHHHHHGGSSIIFIGGFGYPWYYGSSYYDYYPTFYPYGDYGYGGYGSYPTSSYAYSGGSYDGGVYQGGDPGVYQDGSNYQDNSNYQDDQSGGDYGNSGSDSSVAEVQRVLSREGFYHGSIDGVAGSRTFYAIRAYQRSHNLHADGHVSRELLDAMGLH